MIEVLYSVNIPYTKLSRYVPTLPYFIFSKNINYKHCIKVLVTSSEKKKKLAQKIELVSV